MLQQNLTENFALANHDDTDDDRLIQTLTMLNKMDSAKERAKFIKAMLQKLESGRSDSFRTILKDSTLHDTARSLYQWTHMQSIKGKTGLSLRHFAGWNPVMGEVSNRYSSASQTA